MHRLMVCLQNDSICSCINQSLLLNYCGALHSYDLYESKFLWSLKIWGKIFKWNFLSHAGRSNDYAPEQCVLYIWYSKFHFTFWILDKNNCKNSKLSEKLTIKDLNHIFFTYFLFFRVARVHQCPTPRYAPDKNQFFF